MNIEEKVIIGVPLALCLFLIAGILYIGFVVAPENQKQVAAYQVRVDKFYAKHNCKPGAYIPTKYEPVRSYNCDNGVFITRDMATE